jgi:excisionase family DNA binding protein
MEDHRRRAQQALTSRSAASRLDMTQEGLRYRIRQGTIKAVRIGSQYRVPLDEIERLLGAE